LGASTYFLIALRCPHGARLLIYARLRTLGTKRYEISGLGNLDIQSLTLRRNNIKGKRFGNGIVKPLKSFSSTI